MTEDQDIVIGIDLGTSTTSVAVFKCGRLEALRFADKAKINSVVTFKGSEVQVGTDVTRNYARSGVTVYETKRLIGKKFCDIQEEIKINKWSFEVVEGEGGMAAIKVPNKLNKDEKPRIVTPEEVASYILIEVKKEAEKYCGCTINHCIITCPVVFDALQRKATMEAGYIAGFTNVELVTEPCAAAVTYALQYDPAPEKEHLYLVYDLGGGTFDVSVVRRKKNVFQVVRTGGDEHLGGKDADLKLMQAVEEQMKNTNLQLKKNQQLLFKARCKQAKEVLSQAESTVIDLDFSTKEDEEMTLTSSYLSYLVTPLISKTLGIVLDVLHACSPPLEPSDIDYVFLMGGSTRLRIVSSKLSTLFSKEQIIIDQRELVDTGIAQGALLIAESSRLDDPSKPTHFYAGKPIPRMKVYDLCPQAIRIACEESTIVVIPEQTPMGEPRFIRLIPLSNSYPNTDIRIYMGNSEQWKLDRFLGTVRVPIHQDVSSVAQSLYVKMTLMNWEEIDVEIECEYDHKRYHSVVTMGLNDKNKSDLAETRALNSLRETISSKGKNLKSQIAVLCDKCREFLSSNDPLRQEVDVLSQNAVNKQLSNEELEAILSRIRQIIQLHSCFSCWKQYLYNNQRPLGAHYNHCFIIYRFLCKRKMRFSYLLSLLLFVILCLAAVHILFVCLGVCSFILNPCMLRRMLTRSIPLLRVTTLTTFSMLRLKSPRRLTTTLTTRQTRRNLWRSSP